jgi:thiol-disulfide isomerase/thioredoxin
LKKFLIAIFCLFALSANAKNPVLKITQLDGKVFDLAAQKDKIVIINFWAKWCANCRREMPILDEVYKEYKSRGFEIISINIDSKRHREEVQEVAKHFSFPNSMTADAIEVSFSQPHAVPTNYLIGKNGEFISEIFSDEELTKDRLVKILKEKL